MLEYAGCEVHLVDTENIANGILASQDFDMLALTGGYATIYRMQLDPHADIIRDFISNGGAYFGICAGAFYACDRTVWDGTAYDYTLDLYDGDGIGPIDSLAPWPDYDLCPIDVIDPDFPGHNGDFSVLYYGGPYFSGGSHETVAEYVGGGVDGEAACINFTYGASGRVCLWGPHPEVEENGGDLTDPRDWSFWDDFRSDDGTPLIDPESEWDLCAAIIAWLVPHKVVYGGLPHGGFTEGAGFVWLDADLFGEEGKAPEIAEWEAPSMDGCFGVGFDASNPPNRDPFRGSGNIYDRPQHEISLHWDGMEIVKKTTPMDFRDEKPHAVRVLVEFTAGGADVSVFVDGTAVFEEYFIPSMIAYRGRPAFGARNGETAGDVLLDNLSIECREPIESFEAPVEVMAIDHKINDVKHPRNETEVVFPAESGRFARIVCTLRLDKPETRFDPWDRTATICVWDDDGERFEIIRYITPYHNGHVWKVDVTDFAPLLQGKRKLEQSCGTQGEGWVVTVKFDFYPGEAERQACQVINLWSGSPEIGNPDKPASDFYVPREIALDEGVTGAKVRTVVTGHGMSPNTHNAAEFMPLGRALTVNGETFHAVLWKEDNYLNPCRPQGGTWKYDRAGWAPGDVVRPREVDVSHLITAERMLRIEYALDEYINEGRGKTWAPTHKTEAHLILYRGK